MNVFFLTSYIPLVVFSLTLWWDIRGRTEYSGRDKSLLLSIVIMAAGAVLQIPFITGYIASGSLVVVALFQVVTFLDFLAFFFLEYSIHIRRIENSYYVNDFRKNYRLFRIVLAAGGILAALTAVAALSLRGVDPRVFTGPLSVSSFLFLAWMIVVTVLTLRKVFNLPEGIIRYRKYPFLVLLVVTAVPGFLIWFALMVKTDARFPLSLYLVLNAVYITRVYLEYLFYRTFHLQRRITEQETQRRKRNELAARIISASSEEDSKIIRSVLQDALGGMKDTVVVKEHTFTGALLFRRSGDRFRIDSPDLVIGYCTPLTAIENIKRMNQAALTELLLKQSCEHARLSRPAEPGEPFGLEAIRTMIRTGKPVRVDPIPGCYRGMHELIHLVPVYDRDRLDGFLVLFKDGFGSVLPEEERALATLVDDLTLIFLLKEGKDVQVERNRLQGEMEIARNIQTSIVPATIEIPGYACACAMTTATEVGGDVYDAVSSGGRTFVGIGDVAGHGLPAGMMALIQMAAFHATVATAEKAGRELLAWEVYDIVNRVLCRINRDRIGSDKFMTQNYFTASDGRLEHAGTHLPALRYSRARDAVIEMTECANRTGFLGLSEFISAKDSQCSFAMDPGDTLLLYTDGVIEAKNMENEQFGIERLKRVVERMKDGTPGDLIGAVTGEVTAFASAGDLKKHSGRFADDITMVVLKKL